MTTPHQTAARGNEAARVLESEVFREAMAGMHTAILSAVDSVSVNDDKLKLRVMDLRKAALMFEGVFVGMVQAGKLAQREIDINSLRDESPARQFFRKVTG
jgi:hypothetical protein